MHSKVTSYIYLIIAVCLWGSSFIGSKIALQTFSPLLLCLLRFLISSVLLSIGFVFQKDRALPGRNDMKYILLSALLGITLYYYLENTAVTLTSASNASVISASYPILTIIVGCLFYKLRPNRSQIAGIVLGVVGVMVLTVSGDRKGSALTGDALILFNGFLWAEYNYLTQKISKDCSDYTVTLLQTLIGTVGFLPFLPFVEVSCQDVSLSAIIALLFLSVGCTLVALLLYNRGLRQVSAAMAASLMNLMPVAGICLSVLILGEQITLRHVVGCLIIIAGVLLSSRQQSRPD